MSAVVFDGLAFAKEKEQKLKKIVAKLSFTPRLLTIVFNEDESSQLYTKLKMKAAVRVGIDFDRIDVSFKQEHGTVKQIVNKACQRQDVHGIMIQKPAKRTWREHANKSQITTFSDWWVLLTTQIDPKKDVDCLNPKNLTQIYAHNSQFMPATAKAIISILNVAFNQNLEQEIPNKSVVIIGRSDIVGRPVASVLKHKGALVSLLGSKDNIPTHTSQADVIISATGVPSLFGGENIKPGAVIIDVGSPKADVDFESVSQIASFITPVPDGVGPVTVVCLLENLIQLTSH